jgi:hypothetical protein
MREYPSLDSLREYERECSEGQLPIFLLPAVPASLTALLQDGLLELVFNWF